MKTTFIDAVTPEEKRAMAAKLEEIAPDVLADLKMFSEAFGPLEEIHLEIEEDDARERSGGKVVAKRGDGYGAGSVGSPGKGS